MEFTVMPVDFDQQKRDQVQQEMARSLASIAQELKNIKQAIVLLDQAIRQSAAVRR